MISHSLVVIHMFVFQTVCNLGIHSHTDSTKLDTETQSSRNNNHTMKSNKMMQKGSPTWKEKY